MVAPKVLPDVRYAVGPIINATDQDGNTVKVVAPGFVALNPDGSVPASGAPAPVGTAYTDRSIANLAGSSESLMAANASRRILIVYNIGATDVAVNLTGGAASLTAAGSVVLKALTGSLVLDSACPVGAITIIGTLNADVTAYEG